MSAKTIEDIDAEISRHQLILERLNTEKNLQLSLLADAKRQRPSGIPISWLPTYDERNGNAIVTAWFDPNKYGSNFILYNP